MNVITSPAKQLAIVLSANEANTLLTSLLHVRQEYLSASERQLISSTAYEIGSRLQRVVQIADA